MTSSGYIIEFHQETGFGLIEEETTKQVLSVHFNSFKQRSKRYLTKNNSFVGELFDFDIITKKKNENDDTDTFEAVNVRHRVLRCPIEGCSRMTAFTNKKALEDHINTRHIVKEEKQKTSPPTVVAAKKPKKERCPRPKPIVISLSGSPTTATIGRFIGKDGINLKRFERQNQVILRVVNTREAIDSIQIMVKPISRVMFDTKLLTDLLQNEWKRCIQAQKWQEESFRQRFISRMVQEQIYSPPIESDSRYTTHSSFLQTKRSKEQKLFQKWKYQQIEGCDKSLYSGLKLEKSKKKMKNHQWRVNEQLIDIF